MGWAQRPRPKPWYVLKEEWCLAIARALPKWLKYWVVIGVACDATDENPGEVKAADMLDAIYPPPLQVLLDCRRHAQKEIDALGGNLLTMADLLKQHRQSFTPWCHYCGYNNPPYCIDFPELCYQCRCENVHCNAPQFVKGPRS